MPRDRRPHVLGVPLPRGFGEAVRSALPSEKPLLAKVDERIDDELRNAAVSLSSLAVPGLLQLRRDRYKVPTPNEFLFMMRAPYPVTSMRRSPKELFELLVVLCFLLTHPGQSRLFGIRHCEGFSEAAREEWHLSGSPWPVPRRPARRPTLPALPTS
jgi:hypothetical protein